MEHLKQHVVLFTQDDAVGSLFGRLLTTQCNTQVTKIRSLVDLTDHLLGPSPPDLLVVDADFKQKVAESIRADHQFDGITIFALVPNGTSQQAVQLLSLGVNDFVEKTASPAIFVARVKALLRQKQALKRIMTMAAERDVFAAGVLHDIRNIESTILAICEFARRKLKKDPVGNQAEVRDLLAKLDAQASRLGKYAGDVIQSVRADKQSLKMKNQNLRELVEWVAEMTSEEKGPAFTWEWQGPSNIVTGDEAFLKLALLNVLQNAIKYSRPQVPTHVVIHQELKTISSEQHVITRFRDNGKGIPEQELQKVFEPFVRGTSSLPDRTNSDSAKADDKGSGLGLSLVKRVVSKMQGRVWAETPRDQAGPGVVIAIELRAGIE